MKLIIFFFPLNSKGILAYLVGLVNWSFQNNVLMHSNTVKYRIRNSDHANDYKISIFVVTQNQMVRVVYSQSQMCDTVAKEVSVTL